MHTLTATVSIEKQSSFKTTKHMHKCTWLDIKVVSIILCLLCTSVQTPPTSLVLHMLPLLTWHDTATVPRLVTYSHMRTPSPSAVLVWWYTSRGSMGECKCTYIHKYNVLWFMHAVFGECWPNTCVCDRVIEGGRERAPQRANMLGTIDKYIHILLCMVYHVHVHIW